MPIVTNDQMKGWLSAIINHYDISIIICSIIIWVISTTAFPSLRLIFGLAITLLFAGYLLTLVLFPRKGDINLRTRFFLSVVLSLAAAPIIGVSLKYLGVSISTTSLMYLFIGLMGASMVGVLILRRKMSGPFLPPRGVYEKAFVLIMGRESGTPRLYRLVAIILACSMVGSVVYISFLKPYSEQFTEFYILSENGDAQNYPHNVTVDQSLNVTVGIINHEQRAVKYTVSYWLVSGSALDGRYVPSAQLFLGHLSVALDPINVPITDERTTQFETSIHFSISKVGDYRVWFVLTTDDTTIDFDALEVGNDYLDDHGDILASALNNTLDSLFLTVHVS